MPDSPASIGPGLRALVVYLLVFQQVPVERRRLLIAGVAGAAVSDGLILGWENLAGHQACCAHLVRDFEDAAQCWPGTIWPGQAQRALRGLIRAWQQSRHRRLGEIPAAVRGPPIKEFKHAVLAGLSDVPRIPGPKHTTAQHRLDVRAYIDTARKHGQDVMTVLHSVTMENPWTPPAPA